MLTQNQIDRTASGIIGALSFAAAPSHRSRAAIDAAEKMAARAARGRIVILKHGARRLLQFRGDFLARFDIAETADPIAHVRWAIRMEVKRGRLGHWSYDGNKLAALREAMLALRYLRRFSVGEVA